MTRSYVWHNHPERPDESYCSQEKVWKPKSELNWYDKQQGILQQICRDCEQQQSRASYAKHKERAKVINRVGDLGLTFSVAPDVTRYIGRLFLEVPRRVTMGVPFTYTVQDARDATLAAVHKQHPDVGQQAVNAPMQAR